MKAIDRPNPIQPTTIPAVANPSPSSPFCRICFFAEWPSSAPTMPGRPMHITNDTIETIIDASAMPFCLRGGAYAPGYGAGAPQAPAAGYAPAPYGFGS